jgi:hypothetical protein
MKTNDFDGRDEVEKKIAAVVGAAFDDFWESHKDDFKGVDDGDLDVLRETIVAEVEPELRDVAEASAKQLLDDAGIETVTVDDFSGALDKWAEERAKELAELVVSTTKEGLDAVAADDVEGASSLFNASRAESVGITEATTAIVGGAMVALAASGLMDSEGIWKTEEDELVCDDCDELNNTVIDMELPPLHPNCRCWIEYDVVGGEMKGGAGSGNFGHGGRPGMVGGSGEGGGSVQAKEEAKPGDENHVGFTESERAAEDRWSNMALRSGGEKGIEVAVVYNDKGELVMTKDGEAHQVAFENEEVRAMKGNGFVHNHPSGNSFSVDDVLMARQADMSSMTAAGDRFIHTIRPAEGGSFRDLSREDIIREYSDSQSRHFPKALEIYNTVASSGTQEMAQKTADSYLFHNVMKDVSTKMGFRYSRRLRV